MRRQESDEKNECTEPRLRVLLSAYELGILQKREKEELERHLLECDRCCEDLYTTSALVLAKLTPGQRIAARTRRWYRPVAAAMLVLALTGAFTLYERFSDGSRRYPPPDDSITLISPEGEVAGDPIVFRWTPETALSSYELTIFDERGDSIWALLTTRTDTTLTMSDSPVLEPGKAYYWRVAGMLDGRIVSVTPVSGFRIAAE
jgi:hypothetical protein